MSNETLLKASGFLLVSGKLLAHGVNPRAPVAPQRRYDLSGGERPAPVTVCILDRQQLPPFRALRAMLSFDLEEELGVRLLLRDRRTVQLTAPGEAFRREALRRKHGIKVSELMQREDDSLP